MRRCEIALFLAALAVACAGRFKQTGVSAAPAALASAGKGSATVYWRHPNDPDISGYNIYRSESENRAFVKVNKEIIRPAPEAPNQHYTDRGLVEGMIYYYYIEAEHHTGGRKERITPVTPVIVGKPWEETE